MHTHTHTHRNKLTLHVCESNLFAYVCASCVLCTHLVFVLCNPQNTLDLTSDFLPEPSKFDAQLLQPLSILGDDSTNIDPVRGGGWREGGMSGSVCVCVCVTICVCAAMSLTCSTCHFSCLCFFHSLQFIEEYAKLQQALRKSHESEARFINKCKSLTKQTRAHTHKLTALSALHQADLKKKKQLTEEIEKYKLQASTLGNEVKEKREAVKTLRSELHALGTQLEESSNDFLRQQRNQIARLELEVNKFTSSQFKGRKAVQNEQGTRMYSSRHTQTSKSTVYVY